VNEKQKAQKEAVELVYQALANVRLESLEPSSALLASLPSLLDGSLTTTGILKQLTSEDICTNLIEDIED
jgi:hypothetical protein